MSNWIFNLGKLSKLINIASIFMISFTAIWWLIPSKPNIILEIDLLKILYLSLAMAAFSGGLIFTMQIAKDDKQAIFGILINILFLPIYFLFILWLF